MPIEAVLVRVAGDVCLGRSREKPMKIKREITMTTDELRTALYDWLSNTEHAPNDPDDLEVFFVHVGGEAEIPTVQMIWTEEREA